jgi:hypothetical protein
MLTADWTAMLLEDVARAEIAHRHLVLALRRLRMLPGSFAVRPHTILRNLFKEIGWQEDLAEDLEMLREELRHLRHHIAAWERLDRTETAAQTRRTWPQRLIAAITGRGPRREVAPTRITAAPAQQDNRPELSRRSA